MIGLVGARGGSQRIPRKALEKIAGRTLIEIAVTEALHSKVFEEVVFSTDDQEMLAAASEAGAVALLQPPEISGPESPDRLWVNHVLRLHPSDSFAILRPTSPFRTQETIKRAFWLFASLLDADSMRAVSPVSERPEKMWRLGSERMRPFMPSYDYELHSKSFAPLWVQNGCLEMAWSRVLPDSVSGSVIYPFFTEGLEGFDINAAEDLEYARYLAGLSKSTL